MKINKFLTAKLPPYIFAAINEFKKEAETKGNKIIDFGMGNPDLSPPEHALKTLCNEVQKPDSYGYGPTGGIDDLKQALCSYYKRRFGVELEHRTESLITIGAKEGITSLASAISNNDEFIAISDPSYPIHNFGFSIAGCKVELLNNKSAAEFIPELKNIIAKKGRKPIAVLVNYPCNPTCEIVDLKFYQDLVDFCYENKIYIISDIAYSEIYFDNKHKPNSILECKNAKEISIEFSSTSKSYSMAGCRVGFAVGSPKLIASLAKIKAYLDYGSFSPLQKAAIAALSERSDPYLAEIRKTYSQRADFLIALLQKELDWKIKKPDAGMYLWAKLPKKFQHMNSFDFCKRLILECSVAFCPGSSFGKNGEKYVRISLIHNKEKMIKAIKNIQKIF